MANRAFVRIQIFIIAYASAILTLAPVPEHLGGFGFPIIIGWIGGAIMAGIGALLVGIPTLRLKGDYLAIATLGIATTIVLVIRNEKWLSNGVCGIRDIPQPLPGIVEPHNYPSYRPSVGGYAAKKTPGTTERN